MVTVYLVVCHSVLLSVLAQPFRHLLITKCMQTVEALVKPGVPEPSLKAYVLLQVHELACSLAIVASDHLDQCCKQ